MLGVDEVVASAQPSVPADGYAAAKDGLRNRWQAASDHVIRQ
jgi:hypothetical protein